MKKKPIIDERNDRNLSKRLCRAGYYAEMTFDTERFSKKDSTWYHVRGPLENAHIYEQKSRKKCATLIVNPQRGYYYEVWTLNPKGLNTSCKSDEAIKLLKSIGGLKMDKDGKIKAKDKAIWAKLSKNAPRF